MQIYTKILYYTQTHEKKDEPKQCMSDSGRAIARWCLFETLGGRASPSPHCAPLSVGFTKYSFFEADGVSGRAKSTPP